MENLKYSRTCVFNVCYHIVWSTKYRKQDVLLNGNLWNSSTYIESVGNISEISILKYIENQKKS
jgi:REP element-mobilizing transposase RayT